MHRTLAIVQTVGLAALLAIGAAIVSGAADPPPPDYGAELPRIPPVVAEQALETFQVASGFRLEQAAAEPLVADPVAMCFDADSRLYVVEMRDYSEQDQEFLGQVRLLVDTDADGRFDRSEVFADKLSWPTAIACWDGGVFVGAPPDIYYLKDTDGDSRADVHKTVFSGFERSNVQGLLNSFHWTLDNRIEGATGTAGGQVVRADRPEGAAVPLSGRDFAFDPRTLTLVATSGGAQHGMTFDDWGRKFDCSNSDHLQQVMFEDRYIARNPYLSAPSSRISIAADGPQAEVFRQSPIEPWRIVRTRLRVSGAAPGPVEGGGRAAGYFTGATGVTIYRGAAWPAELRGLAVVGDVGGNLVHRKRLDRNGLEFTAHRIDDQSEFVASRDIWFRPAQFANAPDGTLYILDVYREVIEHPDSLPPDIKKHLDLTSGRDRGRLYRIVPDGFVQPPLAKLSQATTSELVATLANPNGWHRDTASRLIYERQDSAAIEPLQALVRASDEPLARMHALYALSGLDALTTADIVRGLGDEHAQVRRHAVRLAEKFASAPGVRERLLRMVGDDDEEVRCQLAYTLGEVDAGGRATALAALAKRGAGDRWQRLAVLSSLGNAAGQVFARLSADEAFRRGADGRRMLAEIAEQAGLAARQPDVAAVMTSLNRFDSADDEATSQAVVGALAKGLAQRKSPLLSLVRDSSGGRAAGVLSAMIDAARATAVDGNASTEQRLAALETLALAPLADSHSLFAELLAPQAGPDIQQAALAALGRFDDASVAELVLAAWPALGPRQRVAATETLLARSERLPALFDAVESGVVSRSDLDPARVKLLANHPDGSIAKRALALFGEVSNGHRDAVVADYRKALELPGDVDSGRAAFRKVCAACHRLEGTGHEIGANLGAIKNRGAEAILVNVLDPSREVNPQYVNYIVQTDDGRTVSGMIAAETAASVTLKRAENEVDTVLRVNIEEMQSTGASIMPEGLEKQITPQDMADLIAYLLAVE